MTLLPQGGPVELVYQTAWGTKIEAFDEAVPVTGGVRIARYRPCVLYVAPDMVAWVASMDVPATERLTCDRVTYVPQSRVFSIRVVRDVETVAETGDADTRDKETA